MDNRTKMNIGLLVCIVGALVSFLGVAFEWSSINVTLVDGTHESASISGWQLLTEDGPSEVIEATFLPAIVILVTILALAVCILTRVYPGKIPHPTMLTLSAFFAILICQVIFMGLNGALIDNTGTESPVIAGMIGTTPWLESLFSGEIYTGRITNGFGGFVGALGALITYTGSFLMVSHVPNHAHTQAL